MKKKAIVLLSGGLDSAVTLFWARKNGFDCSCLLFDYGQRHVREIESAKKIARKAGCGYKIIRLRFPWKGSSLTDKSIHLPKNTAVLDADIIPSTYVPARNTIFLSMALSYAEATGASAIFIGANSVDFSGYPDCRPQYYRAFRKMAALGTRCGTEGRPVSVLTPLIKKSKAQIIRLARKLGVPVELTWSCYSGGRTPCGKCDSCRIREKGFKEAVMSHGSAKAVIDNQKKQS